MSKVPQDIDRLLWSVAEDGSPRAIADFENRFPQFKIELGQRIRALHALKGAKPRSGVDSIPRFAMTSSSNAPKRWVYALGMGALAALGFGSYLWTAKMVRPVEPATPATVSSVLPSTMPPGAGNDMSPKVVPHSVQPSGTQPNPPLVAKQGPKLFSLRMKEAPLEAVLAAIGIESGLKVHIAPGLVSSDIEIDFPEMSGMQMLAQLGQEHGFTAFDEGGGSVLIIPARDNQPASPAGNDPDNSESP